MTTRSVTELKSARAAAGARIKCGIRADVRYALQAVDGQGLDHVSPARLTALAARAPEFRLLIDAELRPQPGGGPEAT